MNLVRSCIYLKDSQAYKSFISLFTLEDMPEGKISVPKNCFLCFLHQEGTKVVQPLLLGGLIRYFTPNTTTSRTEAWMYAMGVAFCAIVLAISHHPYFFAVQRIGMRMRIACCSLMYKKVRLLRQKNMTPIFFFNFSCFIDPP